MRVGRVRTLPGWRHGAEVAEASLCGAGCSALLHVRVQFVRAVCAVFGRLTGYTGVALN